MTSLKITPLSLLDIERLRPLWLALHAHHQNVAPRLAPFVSDERSWINRKRQYEKILCDEGFGFIARNGSSDIGYLLCAKRPMRWTATFAMPPMLWELITLFVDRDRRGEGIGSMMLDAMDEAIARSDIRTKLVGVIPDNHRALALYQSRGFVPTWLTLTRFQRSPLASVTPTEVHIEDLARSEIGKLKSLWLALHHHHQAVSLHLAPFVDNEYSWTIIKNIFTKNAKDELLLIAREDNEINGFANVVIHNVADMPEYSDTWATGDKIAEIKFLVVAEGSHGKDIGTALMNAVDAVLVKQGVRDRMVGALEPNKHAISFYESRGFLPTWLEMIKH